MRTPALVVFALALGSLSASAASAQRTHLVKGERVRLITPLLELAMQRGRIVSADNDSIVFQSDAYSFIRTFAIRDIDRIDVSVGTHHQASQGALTGLGIGVVGGAIVGAIAHTPCPEGADICIVPNNRAATAAIVGAVFGLVGAGAGAIIGSFVQEDDWEPVVVKPTFGLNPAGKRTFGFQVGTAF